MKHIALYARTSTHLQASGLEAQISALKGYCAASQITNFRVYQDEGVSGSKTKRPALDQLMADAEADQISTVVVFSFSRFARSVSHLLSALEVFNRLNIAFVSLSERIDTGTPVGRMTFTVCAAVAELEKELIRERVKCGIQNARAKGKTIGRKRTRNSELIQQLSLKGFSYRQIARLAQCSISTVAEELKFKRCSENEDSERRRVIG